MADQKQAEAVNKTLEEEVNKTLAKQPIPEPKQKKKKSKYQKLTLAMSIFMTVVMAGSVIYAAYSAWTQS
ncbi:DUF4044 domain-containing protein [Leuconostocaceae bacterium ESL0958]|nr:DUF4044 domain-containing protein [Leuconostocaceae bacterium ESL0958]